MKEKVSSPTVEAGRARLSVPDISLSPAEHVQGARETAERNLAWSPDELTERERKKAYVASRAGQLTASGYGDEYDPGGLTGKVLAHGKDALGGYQFRRLWRA